MYSGERECFGDSGEGTFRILLFVCFDLIIHVSAYISFLFLSTIHPFYTLSTRYVVTLFLSLSVCVCVVSIRTIVYVVYPLDK